MSRKTERIGFNKKISRREALSTAGKIAISVVVAGGVAGVGGYLAGSAAVPPARTITETKIVTAAAATVTQTITQTVTAPTTPKRDFSGVTLVVSTLSGPYVANTHYWVRKSWQQETGGKIEVIEIPWGEFLPKIIVPLSSGQYPYDIITVGPYFHMPEIIDHIVPLDDYVKNDPDLRWDDFLTGVQEMCMWGDHIVALPMDGDSQILYFRKDLLMNEDYRRDFKKKYGYEMPDPVRGPLTWKELIDLCEFFNRWDWNNDGKPEIGFPTAEFGRYGFNTLVTAAAFFKSPYQKAYFFDPDTMEPLIDNPGWVKALAILKELYERGSDPSVLKEGFAPREVMVGGGGFATIDYGDIGQIELGPESMVKGKLGYTIIPGAEEVYDWVQGKWIKVKGVHPIPEPKEYDLNFAPHHAFGGWVCAITKGCAQKGEKYVLAAYDYIRTIASPEWSLKLVTDYTTKTGANPFRKSHFNWSEWKKFGYEDPNYIKAQIETMNHPNKVVDLRIPGVTEYLDRLAYWMFMSISADVDPEEAMKNAASEWREITNKRGKDIQLKYYRRSLGLST
jgi:multiple sugar transport system substrate-binding protein